MKFVSWNVNGIRSVQKHGLLVFVKASKADFYCFQEVRATAEEAAIQLDGYRDFWNPAEKKGYSGVAVFARHEPLDVRLGMGVKSHDTEGRLLTLEYPDFFLLDVYQPNSQRGLPRLAYRTEEWDVAFLEYLRELDSRKPVIFGGDLNVAHAEMDLANPKTNRRNAGFTDEERAGFSRLLAAGFLDSFREFTKTGGNYSWWSRMANCRERNIGWRVDYFVISQRLRPRLKSASILPSVMGSDHCPVEIDLE